MTSLIKLFKERKKERSKCLVEKLKKKAQKKTSDCSEVLRFLKLSVN